MTCDEARQHWNLYHDSEGDPELHFQIGAHLGQCPECAEWFAKQSRLEGLLAEKLAAGAATPELWDRVLTGAGLRRPEPSRRWLWMSGLAACAATLLLLAGWYWLFPPRTGGADLAHLTAAWHQQLEEGRETVAFVSQDDLQVERYLRQRVSFPVRCPPRKDAGFAVQGAGICRLAEQPAAYLSGKVDATPVSIFVLPRGSLAAFPHQREALRKQRVHRCREGAYAMVLGVVDRNAVLVIGQTDPDRLEQVLSAYGSYPEDN